ncbi:energy-coupled thiamine transporter ThiT [Ornithinibacillus sp. 4-3]|uniref:Energy-coupled thiamine transporter ThiT n=1 Tax=Ornithinibacillus sp. 4-3 TaxID=3231488 RepID=A0AB39HPU5_9BACI
MSSKKVLFLVEVAIFTALALALDLIPFLSFKIWGQGGSISFAMIPVFIIAFRWGLKGGLLSGFLFGILQIPFGAWILTPLQGFIEYGLAFTVIGFAGVFAKQIQQAVKDGRAGKYFTYILLGVLLGTTLRFIGHFIAGVVFFERFMPENFTNIWFYSFVYNFSYLFPCFIICSVAVFFLFYKQPRTLLNTAS